MPNENCNGYMYNTVIYSYLERDREKKKRREYINVKRFWLLWVVDLYKPSSLLQLPDYLSLIFWLFNDIEIHTNIDMKVDISKFSF